MDQIVDVAELHKQGGRQMFTWLAPGRLFLDYGPIQATISAFKSDEPLYHEIEGSCQLVAKKLKELASCLSLAKISPEQVKVNKNLPDILQKMMEAVRKCDDPTLTSMAAVAGTFADIIADFLADKGATKVLVSNGGDLALRLSPGESVKVGIVSNINEKSFSHVIRITADTEIRGMATSGFGGRSFTKGIASAAVAFGRNCREADAAATLIANHTFSPDPGIKMVRAETLDPETDIQGHEVVFTVGNLRPDTPKKALANGMAEVLDLIAKQAIIGAAVFVRGENAVLPKDLNRQILAVDKR